MEGPHDNAGVISRRRLPPGSRRRGQGARAHGPPHVVDRNYTTNFDYTCDILKEIPYNVWRDFDPVDSIRFYALRLKEVGIIKSPPEEIIKRGTDFRYLTKLKRELKEA